jgi:ATP-dependent DNA helicase DinG
MENLSQNKNFTLRKEQQDCIDQIIDEIENNGIENIILNAPTGSGKSIIAMYISNYLYEKHQKNGYILTSNLALQDQYETDFYNFNQVNFVSIKGYNNYDCSVTNTSVKDGFCRSHDLPANITKKLDCYPSCSYYKRREGAIKSPVALLNYQYWLVQKNYVQIKFGSTSFKKREFIIFDESHNIDMILHNHFISFLNQNIDSELKKLYGIFKKYQINHTPVFFGSDYNYLRINNTTSDHINKLKNIYDSCKMIRIHCNSVKDYYYNNVNLKNPNMSQSMIEEIAVINGFLDFLCKLEDFLHYIVDPLELKNIVITKNQDSIHYNSVDSRKYFALFFHRHCPSIKIFMSATWGSNFGFIMKNYSLDPSKTKVINVNPNWNYDKSPVVFMKSSGEMTFNKKQQSISRNLKILNDILTLHEKENGIIHTVNYELSNIIKDKVKNKKLIFYFNSKEKDSALEQFYRDGGILVGPSHFEGMNFEGDTSRFQILMKVPYMTLADSFVSEKSKRNPMWYNWKTFLTLLQGVGRSVRNDKDWCKTYIIDGSFEKFFDGNYNFFPKEFVDRLRYL